MARFEDGNNLPRSIGTQADQGLLDEREHQVLEFRERAGHHRVVRGRVGQWEPAGR